jgi:transposase
MLGAFSLTGLGAAMTGDGVPEGEVLLAVLRQVLGPQLHAGQMLSMANRQAHQVAGVAAAWAAAGVRWLSLPPYSPNFSPSEEGCSKVKARLRAQAARTLEALERALAEARDAVTATDAYGWFAHAGYCVGSK